MKLCLNELSFFGYHGLYKEEKKMGNHFTVEVQIDFTPKSSIVNDITQTIDYVAVYALVKKWMDIPTPLLETLVCLIADDILQTHLLAEKVSVTITKLKLPIAYLEGNASVSIEKSR